MQSMTKAQFMKWTERPEFEDRAFELDRGVPVERPYPGTERHGMTCGLVFYYVSTPIYKRRAGYVLINNVGYWIERNPDTVFCPDIIIFTNDKTSPFTNDWVTDTPDMIVEVLDHRDDREQFKRKSERYLAAGVRLVWLVCSCEMLVMTMLPGSPIRIHSEDDEITGEGVLPDFHYRVADLFRPPYETKPLS